MNLTTDNTFEFTTITDSYITQDFTTEQGYLFTANSVLRFVINSNSSSPSTEELRFVDDSTLRMKFASNNDLNIVGQVRLNAGKKLGFNTSLTTAVYRDSSTAKLRFVANGTEVMTMEDSSADNAIVLNAPKIVFHNRLIANAANYGMTIPAYTTGGEPPDDPAWETGDIWIQSNTNDSIYRVWGYFGDSGGGWYYADLVT